ncbi:MAG: hypothetical protein QOH39_1513 [Verrucomicrobiota bacterium]|jgi:hypothetical protein
MQKKSTSESGIFNPRVFAAFVLCSVGTLLGLVSFATTPANGTISDSSTSVTYTGGPFNVPTNATDSAGGPVTCDSAHPCDDFPLHTNISAAYKAAHPDHIVTIEVSWSDPTSQQDLDIFLVDTAAPGGPYTSHGTNAGDNPEVMKVPVSALATGAHDYIVRVIPFVSTGQTYTGKITLGAPAAVGPTPTPPPPFVGIAPRYYNYSPGSGQGENAGEPSIGYNVTSKKAMFLAGLQTFQVSLPEITSPNGTLPATRAGACEGDWLDKTFVFTGTRSADPILYTDQGTGRTFVSQLNTETQTNPVLIGLNSLMAYTDDDGATWTAAQLNLPDGSNDHQTVGAGPYPAAFAGLANPQLNKGHAVYYCGQAGYVLAITGSAYCSRSDDGGLNFGKAVIAYTDSVSGCAQSIHGHVKVGPDGTVYLPNSSCNGHPAVAVSTDAGTTWTVKEVPTGISSPAVLDPSVAIANDNTVYLFFIGKPDPNSTDGHVYATVSHNHGDTWSTPFDIGAGAGVVNAVFPAAIAGDGNRAACAFLGTSTNGDHQAADFKGIWYGYVAHTYDGGATWVTVNATPNGPVQRESCIWNSGGNNVCRNLLDFNDITMDENGMVLFGFADGCVGSCETGGPNSYSSKATIARQSGGKGLLAQFDPAPPEPIKPQAACLSGTRDDMAAYLDWVVPDNGGLPITSYKIYRKDAAGGTEQLVGQPTNGKSSFVDRTGDPTVATYIYRITALNAQGEGLTSNSISLSIVPRVESLGACVTPGVQVIVDPAGDASSNSLNALPSPIPHVGPSQDITSISMSEPMTNTTTGVASNLVFTMKVVSMTTIPPGWRWAVRFQVNKGGNLVQPPPDATMGPSEDFFVAMVTSDVSTTPTFVWGTTSVPQNAARVFTTKGNLDASSNVTPDGTITMVLPKSIISNPGPGDSITAMLGSVRLTLPSTAPSTGGTNETIVDSTNGGDSYVLRATNLCFPNTAPIARLTADVNTGLPGVTVHFDGNSSSDANSIDTIASYTFNFDDGLGDVTQNTPTISHTFPQSGEYIVRMIVHDSRGKISSNTAKFIVDVQQPLGVATVVSRKMHGSAGNFDIDLPLTGNAGVECRAAGSNNTYQLVYTFNKAVTVPGTATKAQGNALVGVPTLGPDPTQVTVPIRSVSNAQHLIINLSGVQNSVGEIANNQMARMDVLLGDVNASHQVDSGDVFLVQKQNGQALPPSGSADFRRDINGNGSVDSGDVFTVQKQNPSALSP